MGVSRGGTESQRNTTLLRSLRRFPQGKRRRQGGEKNHEKKLCIHVKDKFVKSEEIPHIGLNE